MVDWSEYKRPVQVITNQMQTKLEGQILEVIQNVGVVLDKEELIKAMNYDRDQYASGFENGYNKAVDDLTANITERFFGMAMSSGLPTEGATWENAIRQVKQIAEQLKGTKRNEDFK